MAWSSAHAADLPMKAAPAPVAVGYDWSGIYFGGHIGGGWSTNEIADPGLGIVGVILNVPITQTAKGSGFLGGVQGGVNYQIGRFVIGSEYDWSWTDLKATNTTSFIPSIGGGGATFSRALGAKTDWTGTSTVRLGWATGSWLFYEKLGAAVAHTSYTDVWTTSGATLFNGTGSTTRIGWTVGTGVEWGFAKNWSAKVEFDYMDFGSKTTAVTSITPGTPISFGLVNSQTISEVKAGLNYRFMPLP
jgi:outer membrane immunogenic protein